MYSARWDYDMEVFKDTGLDELLNALMDGYHATVFAYGLATNSGVKQVSSDTCGGQTGSGKTYTMEGWATQFLADLPTCSLAACAMAPHPQRRFQYQPGTNTKAPQAGMTRPAPIHGGGTAPTWAR